MDVRNMLDMYTALRFAQSSIQEDEAIERVGRKIQEARALAEKLIAEAEERERQKHESILRVKDEEIPCLELLAHTPEEREKERNYELCMRIKRRLERKFVQKIPYPGPGETPEQYLRYVRVRLRDPYYRS